MVAYYRLLIKSGEDFESATFKNVQFKVFLSTFFTETTMHGVPQVFRQPGIIKKLFWVIAILLCAGGLIWELGIFYDQFISWQATTTVSIAVSRELYFPAVTICNNNPVTNDWYQNVMANGGAPAQVTQQQQQPQQQQQQQQQQPSSQQQPFSGLVNPSGSPRPPTPGGRRRRDVSPTPTPNQAQQPKQQQNNNQRPLPPRQDFAAGVQAMLAIQEKTSSLRYEQRSVAGHQLCDMVLGCQFGGVSCDPGSNMSTWHWSPTYGNCFTFNAGYTKANSPRGSTYSNIFEIKKGDDDSSGIRVSTQLGDTYGLYLLLNADVANYLPFTQTVGWRIVVHNQTDMPFPEEQAILIGPGSSSRIALSLKYAQRLGIENNYVYDAVYSNCVDASSLNLDDTKNAYAKQMEVGYTESACLKTCYQVQVMTTCSCFDFNYPNRGAAFSSISNADTLKPCGYNNETAWRCKEKIALAYRSDQLNCDCPEKCKMFSIESTVSSVKWPNSQPASMTSVCQTLLTLMNSRIQGQQPTCQNKSQMARTAQDTSGTGLVLTQLRNCVAQTLSSPFDTNEEVAAFVVGKQFAEVFIYYKDFNYQVIVESQQYELSDLLAYLGGIFGLFFGFTFLTFFEFVQLIVECIAIGIAKLINRSKVEDSDSPRALERNDDNKKSNNRQSSALSRSSTATSLIDGVGNSRRNQSIAKPNNKFGTNKQDNSRF